MSPGRLNRREVLALAGLAGVWPHAAAGQAMPVIGFIGVTSFDEWKRYVDAFHQGLGEAGFVAGRNVAMEYRWAESHYDRLPAMAADLVARKVNVIVAAAPPAALAAKAATQSIPIVFFLGSDPVKLGLVPNINRPGGNITGVSALANEIGAKRLQMLREVTPQSQTIGLLINPTNANASPDTKAMQAAADGLKVTLVVAKASTDTEIDAAFEMFNQKKAGGLIINPDPFLLARRAHIAALATHNRLATIFHTHEPVEAGGLMSYGASFTDAHRQVGAYTARILKGEKPGDLPIQQSSTFEMAINLKTAGALGISVPPSMLATADQVIE
jgi:putative ABC transport system substrate-binding protein